MPSTSPLLKRNVIIGTLSWPRIIELFNNLQFTIWPLQISGMPFRLKMLQDVYQAKIDQTYEGWEGTSGIADDLVIFGKSEQKHDQHLHGMLARCRNAVLKLSPAKCKIKLNKITFYGVIFGEDGFQPGPKQSINMKQMAPLLLNRNYRHSLDYQPT